MATSTTSSGNATATGTFHVANGQIVGPNGTPFIAKGINIFDSQMTTVSNSAAGTPLVTDFPGINMVRLAVQDFASASALSTFITQMTNLHIVVEIEDHSAPTGNDNVLTGSALTNELAWYSSIAAAFKSNPYVWFGTMNEPDEIGNEAAVTNQEAAIYNAIRGAGNTNPIMMEQIGGYTSTLEGGLTASAYASMTNIVWDSHYYGWGAGYSTNTTTIAADLTAQIAGAQAIQSADGVVPVIIGETGISTTGSGADVDGTQVVAAVEASKYGSLAWAWSAGTDSLVSTGSTLSAFGTQVAAAIAAAAAATSTSAAPPSANDTVVKAGTAGAIVDASGNTWTIISSGQVAVNGTIDTTTAGVTELAYVSGTIWQENASNLWWSKTAPTAAWGPAGGTSTSPLPVSTGTPAPSPNDTVVLAGSSSAITDASGNTWTITTGGQVAVDGTTDTTTAGVTELAYVNSSIWQENASALWWSKTAPTAAWGPAGGTSTSPLPAPPAPSPNDTMVLAGSAAAITDSSANAWTITASGQVAVNGTADTTTGNVSELAYVNGTIWQENTSNLWWSKATPTAAWGPAGGTSASPLPAPVAIAAGTASATVSQSQVSVAVAAGTHMLFLSGSGDIVSLAGGAATVTDTGGKNTYILAPAGKGTETFTGTVANNVLSAGDTLDLKPALAATNWNGTAATLSKYLTVADSAQGATLSIASTSGGTGVGIASLSGATTATLSSLLTHAIT